MASSSQQHVPPLDDEQETQEAAALLSAMEQYQPVVRADGARPRAAAVLPGRARPLDGRGRHAAEPQAALRRGLSASREPRRREETERSERATRQHTDETYV